MIDLEKLQTRLSQLDSLNSLRSLFADWNYQYDSNDAIILGDFKADNLARESVIGDPQIIARSGEFRVIYAEVKDWNRAVGSERLVISRLLNDYPFALWIFSDAGKTNWHFVNVKRGGKTVRREGIEKTRHVLRRIPIISGRKPGRTVCERLKQLDLESISKPPVNLSELQIQAAHDGAFDVEAVTASFYKGYRHVVRDLQKLLLKQHKKPRWAHALALQTLNRMMFLRFYRKERSRRRILAGR